MHSTHYSQNSVILFVFIRLTFWQSPHGDADHLGDSLNLLENFKVKKIILNNGEINTYEKKLQEYKNN